MNAAQIDAWKGHSSQACYQYILPHLEKYKAEPYLENCLPLMEPRIYAGFAYQAVLDVAALVVASAREQYSRHTNGIRAVPGALMEQRVEDGDEARLGAEFATNVAGFARALEQYAPAYGRFQQVLGQAGSVAWNNGRAYGDAAGRWAGELFGDVAGVIASTVGDYFGGRAVVQQVQAEGEQLQQAFQSMLQSYDQAMAILINSALGVLTTHHRALVAAARGVPR